MTIVEHVSRTLQITWRDAGFSEALHPLFHRRTEAIHALMGLSFTIQDGETVGYIGPSGAGKGSMTKILDGILTPDPGICRVNGYVPWASRREYVKDIGVVFGQRTQLQWDMPVIDSFGLLWDICQVPQAQHRRALRELTTLLSLEGIIHTLVCTLSLSQWIRYGIAASLLHSPSLLPLNEPAIGLDAVSRLAVRDFIVTLNARHKTTVPITTHNMQDIETLTKRVLLTGREQLLLGGTLGDLKSHRSSPDSTLDGMAAALCRDYQI